MTLDEQLGQIWLAGFIAGLREYAWWKDGTQYVGTCGTTLKDAIERAKRDYAPLEQAQSDERRISRRSRT